VGSFFFFIRPPVLRRGGDTEQLNLREKNNKNHPKVKTVRCPLQGDRGQATYVAALIEQKVRKFSKINKSK